MHVARPLTCTRATRQPQRARHTAVRAVHASEGVTLLRQPLLRATLALGRVAAAAALAASVLTAAPVLAKYGVPHPNPTSLETACVVYLRVPRGLAEAPL